MSAVDKVKFSHSVQSSMSEEDSHHPLRLPIHAHLHGPKSLYLNPSAASSMESVGSAAGQHTHLLTHSNKNSTDALLRYSTPKPIESCATSVTLSVTEKGFEDKAPGEPDLDIDIDHYQDATLPDKKLPKALRNLRFIVLNVYRRLFTLCFLANVGVLAWVAARGGATSPYLGTIVIANIFASIVIRQENVVNGLFYLFTSIPKSAPLWLRTMVARIYSLGGIHSGSSVAATMWLIYFTYQVTKDMMAGKASVALVGITYTILILLIVIIALAMPNFRKLHHDSFEMVHRFLGWSATVLVWTQTILLINDFKPAGQPLAAALRGSPAFWLVVILTLSIISSWLLLRKVKVESRRLSEHALMMTFDYATPVPGSFARVSTSPLTEWHSFATITVPTKKGYSMIVSRAGDWTGKAIAEPPSELWVRGVPCFGVMNIVPLFRKLVIVATGSGIAPCAPHLYAKRSNIKLLWASRNIRKTYGDKFVDSILEASPDAIIYDTDARGRPNLVQLVHHVYQQFDAEAVCIIANEPITKKVVYGLMTRGVPAFGAIWDS